MPILQKQDPRRRYEKFAGGQVKKGMRTIGMGMSVGLSPFKLDLACLYNLAAARTADVFGKRNVSVIGTLGFDYAKLIPKS